MLYNYDILYNVHSSNYYDIQFMMQSVTCVAQQLLLFIIDNYAINHINGIVCDINGIAYTLALVLQSYCRLVTASI